jgi:hypothetical protein
MNRAGCQTCTLLLRDCFPKSLPALGIPQGEQSGCKIREASLPALDVQ